MLAYNWDLLDYIYDEDEEIPATEDPRTVVVVSPDTSPATSTVTSPQVMNQLNFFSFLYIIMQIIIFQTSQTG